jgi:hypothetical protein
VELVEVVAPRRAGTAPGGIADGRAGVPRDSLEDIIAASERGAARERNLAATVGGAGQGVRKGDGDGDGWEALPPYAR